MIEHDASSIAEIVGASVKRAPWGWGLTLTVIGMLIKVWPIINDQLIKVKEKRRSDKRDDMAEWRQEMRDRITALETDVRDAKAGMQAANERSHRLEIHLMTVTNAFQMVAGELRKHDPDNPVLKQAVDMVGLAVTEDFGLNRALVDLSRYPGVDE